MSTSAVKREIILLDKRLFLGFGSLTLLPLGASLQTLHLDHHQRDQSKVDGERAALDHFPIEKL